jgi:hypothetical protein
LRPLIRRPLTRVNSYGLANHRSPQRPLGHTLAVIDGLDGANVVPILFSCVRRLMDFPYVLVRLRCYTCERAGAYRLARLSVKYGAASDAIGGLPLAG